MLSRDRRSLTAPRSRVIISLPTEAYPRLCIHLSGCDWWHQKKRVFGGGGASLATSDEVEPRGEEKKGMLSVPPPLHPSSFLIPVLSVINLPHLRSPSELQLLGHFGGDVSKG